MPSTTVENRRPGSLAEGGRALGAFLVLALGFKLLVIMAALGDDPLARHPTSDSLYYLERAAGIAGLIDDPVAHEPHHLPPLYPQILARVPGALEGSFGGVYVLQAVFGTAALAGVYLLARRRAGRAVGFCAAALTLLYGPLTFFEVKLLGDSLACSWLVLALVVTDRLADAFPRHGSATPPTGRWQGLPPGHVPGLLLGLLLGLATLLRPQVMLLIPVLAVWLWMRRARVPALACALTAALLLTPSTMHNLSTGGGFTLVSDNGGVNLWLAATGPPSGTFLTYDEAFGDIARQASSARAVAEGMAGRALSPGEVSDTLRAAAWNAVLAEPGDFMTRLGLRARASVESFETGIVCVPEVEAGLIGPLRILALPFGVILALGGAGVVLLVGRRRPALAAATAAAPAASHDASLAAATVQDATDQDGAPVLPLLAVAGLVLLTTLIFFHYSRFRLPMVPVLVVCAAAAVGSVQRQRPRPGRAALAVLVAGGLAWLSWLPGDHHEDTLAIGWTSLAEARLALAPPAGRREALLAADEDMKRALAHAPALLRARLQAHRVALGLGRFDEASQHLDAVAAVLPDHPQVLMNRAWLHVWQDPRNRYLDLAAARALLEKLELSAALDPELAPHVQRLRATISALQAQPPAGH